MCGHVLRGRGWNGQVGHYYPDQPRWRHPSGSWGLPKSAPDALPRAFLRGEATRDDQDMPPYWGPTAAERTPPPNAAPSPALLSHTRSAEDAEGHGRGWHGLVVVVGGEPCCLHHTTIGDVECWYTMRQAHGSPLCCPVALDGAQSFPRVTGSIKHCS